MQYKTPSQHGCGPWERRGGLDLDLDTVVLEDFFPLGKGREGS